MDGLRLSSAVPKMQWTANPHEDPDQTSCSAASDLKLHFYACSFYGTLLMNDFTL